MTRDLNGSSHTGAILEHKETEGSYKGIPIVGGDNKMDNKLALEQARFLRLRNTWQIKNGDENALFYIVSDNKEVGINIVSADNLMTPFEEAVQVGLIESTNIPEDIKELVEQYAICVFF